MRVLIVTHLELKRVVPSYLKNIVEDGLLPWMSELLSILSNDDTNEYYVVSTSANLARDYHFTKDGINFSVLGLKARLIGRLPFFLRVVLGLSTIKCRFHKIVRKINPDIVSIHGTYGDVQYYAANLKLPKILTIDMFYDLYLNAEESFIHRLYARKEKQLLKRITFYTYRTQIMKEKILETNPSATLFHFCYPIDTVSGTKSYSSVLQREVDMIFAARLHEYKGVFDFIDIMHEVSRYLPDIKVLIIGMGGPEIIAKIHSRILTLGLAKQVSFIPNIENKRDFLKYLESAKLNVYPVSESMISGTMIESLSSGTPIITY
jgi:glycosyltransferase involved in cell wall biosynthesis